MNALKIVIISGDAAKDKFFHAADVFEAFKVFASVKTYALDYEGEMTPERQIKLIETLKDASIQYGERVVAVFVPNDPIGAYLDEPLK